MKVHISLRLLAGAAVVGLGIFASRWLAAEVGDTQLEVVKSPVTNIYLPRGFTEADKAEIVVAGEYPSGCYKPRELNYVVDEKAQEIKLTATSWHDSESYCIQAFTPFMQTVQVEQKLLAGNYDVVMEEDPSMWATMMIEEANLEAPEQIFAPVNEAQLIVDPITGKQQVRISGELPYFFVGCMVVRELVIDQQDNQVLQVKPIAEILEGGAECENLPDDHSYEARSGLNQAFDGNGLLFVRGYENQNFSTLISTF